MLYRTHVCKRRILRFDLGQIKIDALIMSILVYLKKEDARIWKLSSRLY
jgi:hypothetical protein